MIRSGKSQATPWLKLPIESFMPWAELNGVSFNGSRVSSLQANKSPTSQDAAHHDEKAENVKGHGLVVAKDLDSALNEPVLVVPVDMVLSESRVRQLASGDAKLAELLKSCQAIAITPRVTILLFLLYQITIANPNVTARIGTPTPYIEFCKFMPIPRVSTLYTEDELGLFEGTTLVPATKAKLKKLVSEFNALRRQTKNISWLAPVWWGAVQKPMDRDQQSLHAGFQDRESGDDDSNALISLDDWIFLDAIYRSRALEWPGQGEAMVPALDMANHTIPANSTFDVTSANEGVLLLEKDVVLETGDEILISYGDSKSPLEILFSYGFLPDYTQSAGSILLVLPTPNNDPLGPPKAAIAQKESCAPGIRVFETDNGFEWASELLWLLIVNEEDGLEFKVVYGTDLRRELAMFWRDTEVTLRGLQDVLEKDELYDLLKLRASVIVLQQIDRQLRELDETSLDFAAATTGDVDQNLVVAATKLREMEEKLLVSAMDSIELQKADLIESPVVKKYFESLHHEQTTEEVPDDGAEDDFT